MSHTSLSALALLCIALLAVPAAASVALPPIASFSAVPTSGPAPLNVSFTDTSTGVPTGWAWYFGDENYTASTWVLQNASAGWSGRWGHSSVSLPDGSIVLMAGSSYTNDVWRSTDRGVTWTRQTAAAAWSGRRQQSAVALPDGSIVLMGGVVFPSDVNDVWRSVDRGVTWTRQTSSAGWSARDSHSSVALPDGSIVLMGGRSGSTWYNDVWRSTDQGATWVRRNASAGWAPRERHASVVLPDGSIVLMGGVGPSTSEQYRDVWRSVDQGVTWTRLTQSAEWPFRTGAVSAALPDGSIVLAGGSDYPTYYSDLWRSTDGGATWALQTASAGWSPRASLTGVPLPDGSIVLMGGIDAGSTYLHDVWRLETASSTLQNPQHRYTAPGNYTVALQAYNPVGYSGLVRREFVTVRPAVKAVPPGSSLPTDPDLNGKYEDINGNGRKDFADVVLYFNQMTWIAANEPVALFDYNANGRIDFADVVWLFNNL